MKPVVKTKKATTKALTVAVKNGFRNRIETDMRMFYRTTPWGELWEKFYLSYDKTGTTFAYRTIRTFTKEIAQSRQQTDFMNWYLGERVPEGEDDPEQAKYPYATGGPQAWVEKRRTGGWYTRETMRKAFPEWNRRIHALEALRETGKFTAKDLVRYEEMQTQLDEEFKGRFFIPGGSFESGAARANLYLGLTARIDDLKEKAHVRHRASLGINLEDVSGLVQMLTASAINADQRRDGISESLSGIVKMVLAKSQRLKLALPPGVEDKIIEVAADSPGPKKKLQ